VHNLKQHIAFRIVTLLVVTSLLTPIFVKFSHVLAHHEHEICLGENQSHLHEIDMDCEFYKFNINHLTTLTNFKFVPLSIFENQKPITSGYLFLSSFQKLHFSLRGPPLNS